MLRTANEGALRPCGKAVALLMTLALAALVALGAVAAPGQASAAEGSYGYKVTLYAGNGTVDGKDSVSFGPYGYGERVKLDFRSMDIQPTDDRYYVKGVRLAGHDDTTLAAPVFNITADTQYVVAYGMKKDQIAYTVNYLDTEGNALAESQTFYANVGDKPVIAYKYIEGYQPDAYNRTGTLKDNAAENVFDFIYKRVGGTAAGAGDGAQGTDGVGADGAGADGEEGAEAEAAADGEEPLDLIDIDDEENPLAAGEEGAGQEGTIGGIPMAGLVGIIAGVILLIALIAFLATRKRKQAE